jgi:diphthamide synthase (EF-2-diphthine--ammonia ligase)
MTAVFPLWKQDTRKLVSRFLELKFRTVICCVNDAWLGEEWAGKEIDAETVRLMPEEVDACGENGEFHTFCFAGPLFKKEISFRAGDKVYKPLMMDLKKDPVNGSGPCTKGFWYCDLILNHHLGDIKITPQ